MRRNTLVKLLYFIIGYLIQAKAWALPDALFVAPTNTLIIPYADYQGVSYRAELRFEAPDTLKLLSAIPNSEPPEAGGIVPVSAELSFHLVQLRAFGENYQADIYALGNNVFKLRKLAESLISPVARVDFNSPHFSGSGNCQACHNGLKDNLGQDMSIITAWQPTMMANAARDPFWKAQVKHELQQTPTLSAVINDKCSRCHAPMANVEAQKQHLSLSVFGAEGILNPKHSNFALAQEGVSCTVCHQIKNSALLGTLAGSSGNFEIDSFDTAVNRKLYGPYNNVQVEPMQQFVKFTPAYSEHIKRSEHCGSCHDLKTPYVDAKGTLLSTDKASEFPEQMVYSEWQHSAFATTKSCQQCHMKRANGVVIAAQIPQLPKRDDFAQHRIVGANQLMLTMLQDYSNLLGLEAKGFTPVLAESEALARSAASLSVLTPTLVQDTLSFDLKISSNTGHKLPSAYPSRRLIVHVVVRDAQQNIVFESGKVNADGSVQHLEADTDNTRVEPHYDWITRNDQVQVYEDVMEDSQGAVTYTLLRAKQYRKDNRLLPIGFDKQHAAKDIQVIGTALEDADFVGGGDTVHFKLPGFSQNRYTISVELIYQTLGYAFAQALFAGDAPEITQFKYMFNASRLKAYPIAQVTTIVQR